jgi:hypothetical protein
VALYCAVVRGFTDGRDLPCEDRGNWIEATLKDINYKSERLDGRQLLVANWERCEV